MDPDLAVQTSSFDTLFMKMYKMFVSFNSNYLETTSAELNNRIGDPAVIEYIKQVKSFLDQGLLGIKRYKDALEQIDTGSIVFLDDHHTYPTFFGLLSPENQAKIPEFERSVVNFNKNYKMIIELSQLNGLGKNKRRTKRRLKRNKRNKRKKTLR
jgi:hypothetical protein